MQTQGTDKAWHASLESMIAGIAGTAEVRDPYTAGHQQCAARLAAAIAREMRRSENETQEVYLAGLVHDIGKIGIPIEILSRPTRLSEIELELVKTHSQVGHDILRSIDVPAPISTIVLQHHERLDGSGYPQGLGERQITMGAKILTVADVVDAMTAHRPYRAALSVADAIAELRSHKGRRYDPMAADVCIALLERDRAAFLPRATPPPAGEAVGGAVEIGVER
jgi:putative nucleotidyltransferase with HDIG domain